MRGRLLLGGLGWLVSAGVLHAAVQVQLDRQSVSMNETFRVVFSVDGRASGKPDFSPLRQDFDIFSTSSGSQVSIINGKAQSSQSWTLELLARRPGRLRIPPISFGAHSSQEAFVAVRQAAAQAPGAPGQAAEEAFINVEMDVENPYVQQQAVLTVLIYMLEGRAFRSLTLDNPSVGDGEARIERLGKERQYSKAIASSQYRVVELRYAVFPQRSGVLVINPVKFSANMSIGNQALIDPFGGTKGQQRIVRQAQPLQLQVRPMPDGFQGGHWLPVSSFRLTEQWSRDPSSLRQGEAVTRSLRLEAAGALANQMPVFAIPEAPWYRSYPEQPELSEAKEFDGAVAVSVQRLALIPTDSGEFILPAVRVPWWNVKADRQEFAELPERRIAVLPVATAGIAADADPLATAVPVNAPLDGVSDAQVAPMGGDAMPAGVGGVDILWKWGFVASMALWLLTLATWAFRSGSIMGALKSRGSQGSAACDGSVAIERDLGKACRANEAGRVKDLLLRWCQGHWQAGVPPSSLGGLAGCVPESFARSLQRLNQHLYQSGAKDEWLDGMEVWIGFKEMRAQWREASTRRKRRARPSALRPLYPQSQ